MITEVVHHINKRVPCDGCTTRVYAFATEHDADGNPTGRHFCSLCAEKESRGERSDGWRRL